MTQTATFAYESHSEEETERFAAALAGWIEPGAVIALDGDLGAGKTRFSQALAKAIGVKDIVNSPTFTIIKEYEGKKFPLYHMDVYRISLEEADELGLDEYFYGEGLTLVEWASIIADLLPPRHLHIYIETIGATERIFRCEAYGEPYASWCDNLKRNGV
ncbi:tRNA threonylcarbamoyladenosine biosynthesis protein TsaE [Paenibacillus sp. CECT 9249]|uniref:tRNA (adenosine(37)-N6)-threonylcarbamoyltransferase complex ATPase subunit type 1 TsaE n=1 Tax=Paenibacillus sp. CECT 9249 TaxID=2845385 RepID=UPI001E44DF42|nr:tRNA (adenosine(37)-N6)-threonylcarbamoyltransferase complex ATPase subunit type 1 TsaE [Paenibacillus sp. CECT 9249]CAH0119403.1 tRNA threonylcarbamoyladenosine biosynthesis protein TsaE [Paenibacillus sp. CECT 9249]